MDSFKDMNNDEKDTNNFPEKRSPTTSRVQSNLRIVTTKKQRRKRIPITVDRLLGPNGLTLLCTMIAKWSSERDITQEKNLNSFLQVYQEWLSVFAPETPFDEALSKIEKLSTHPALRNFQKHTKEKNISEAVDESVQSSVQKATDSSSSPQTNPLSLHSAQNSVTVDQGNETT